MSCYIELSVNFVAINKQCSMKELFLNFKYSFTSQTGDLEGYRYIQNVSVDIFAEDADEEEEPVLIGKSSMKIILVDQIINEEYDIDEIIDFDNDFAKVYRDDDYGFNDLVLEKYPDCLTSLNICVFETLVLMPEYRGYGISQKIMKDMTFYFRTGCALFVVTPTPLQFDKFYKIGEDAWEKKEWYDGFEKDQKKATQKVAAYFKSLGFDTIKGIKDSLYYSPIYRNDKLDNVDMNETVDIPDK